MSKEGASVAAILNKCSTARPLSVTSFRPRDFVLASVFVLEVIMTDLQAYRFEPERVPYAEDSESEEVNDRLEGTFCCTCERCETIPTQRESVCLPRTARVRKQNGRNNFKLILHWSQSKESFSIRPN